MRYWVYIKNKVEGPYDEEKLVTLDGFSQDTLVCTEEVASKGGQEWVKASSIFEFDEVPMDAVPQQAVPPFAENAATKDIPSASAVEALLAKLDVLTTEMSHLHEKLDSMQTHLDQALEQNKSVSHTQDFADKTPDYTQEKEQSIVEEKEEVQPEEVPAHTPVEKKSIDMQTSKPGQTPATEESATPKDATLTAPLASRSENDGGEDLIISSALDSIYGVKPITQDAEEAFQDLLPEKEKAEVAKISEELTFTPTSEDSVKKICNELTFTPIEEENSIAEEKPVVKEALITTPSADETAKDALINELTASPKEDVLDQIIQEHQEDKEDAPQKGGHASALMAGAAGVGAIAAAATVLHNGDKPTEQNPVEQGFVLATDKQNPDQLEEVLPAEQMPPDATSATEEQPAAALNDLPSLEAVDANAATAQEDVMDNKENTLQELVPNAADLPVLEAKPEPEEFCLKDVPKEEQKDGLLTEKDLQDAFGTDGVPPVTKEAANSNPNDLTEIELKEGSTYLISDFVPPAQVTNEQAEDVKKEETPKEEKDQNQETIIQDMLATSTIGQSTKNLSTDGLPEDAAATRVNLENTIQAKRGASLDIKTVPMVPEPADAQRLDLDNLDSDINAQHDLKTGKSSRNLTKIVIGALVAVLLLIVLYVMLGFLKLLPASLNLFAGKSNTPQAEQTMDEFLPNENVQSATEQTQTETNQALEKVQNFPLPNGLSLQQFIEQKHAAISPSLISWEVTEAVEPDNYSITVKIPPENPQNFKTVYRFNYDMQTGLLDPTISDAKNLLDQAYGQY